MLEQLLDNENSRQRLFLQNLKQQIEKPKHHIAETQKSVTQI